MNRLQRSRLERWQRLIIHGQTPDDMDAHGERRSALRAWFVRFQLLFALLAIVSTVSATFDASVALSNRLLALGIIVFFVLWFRRQVWGLDHHGSPAAMLYIVVSLPLFLILIGLHPAYQLLIFVAYWQLFGLLRTWHAMIGAAVLTFSLMVHFREGPLRFPLADPVDWIVFVAALVMGGSMAAFIDALTNEAEKRRQLIEELKATHEQLAGSERQAGILSERQRIAGEIHDTIAQDLTSVIMHLEAALGRFGAAGHPAADHIQQGLGAARTGIAEARRIVYALLPDVLESQSLVGAIRLTVDKWRRSAGVDASFHLIGNDPALARQVEVTLLRGVQEALTNVRKHAAATTVVVTMTNLSDELALDVRDDGSGFDAGKLDMTGRNVSNERGMGVGLLSLSDRMHALGGALTIESALGEGTTVSIALPLPVEADHRSEPPPEAAPMPVPLGAQPDA